MLSEGIEDRGLIKASKNSWLESAHKFAGDGRKSNAKKQQNEVTGRWLDCPEQRRRGSNKTLGGDETSNSGPLCMSTAHWLRFAATRGPAFPILAMLGPRQDNALPAADRMKCNVSAPEPRLPQSPKRGLFGRAHAEGDAQTPPQSQKRAHRRMACLTVAIDRVEAGGFGACGVTGHDNRKRRQVRECSGHRGEPSLVRILLRQAFAFGEFPKWNP